MLLDDYNVKAELTATTRTGMQRYTFPKSETSNIIIDLKNRDHVLESHIEIISDTKIRGLRKSRRWATEQFVYFYAEFSKPFRSYGIAVNDTLVDGIKKAEGKNIRAFVQFDTKKTNRFW